MPSGDLNQWWLQQSPPLDHWSMGCGAAGCRLGGCSFPVFAGDRVPSPGSLSPQRFGNIRERNKETENKGKERDRVKVRNVDRKLDRGGAPPAV